MRVLCPICRELLPIETLICPNGHTFSRKSDGIPNLLPPELSSRLDAIGRYREKIRAQLPTITDYEGLPNSLAESHFEWRGRAQSLGMIKRLIQIHQPKSFLEIGGWNGWLTHHLAGYGAVTAVDFFADSHDGLGAMTHYQARWNRVQMDITDLTILDGGADMVIINNGAHLLKNPLQTIQQAQHLVADGGVLVILEMPFYSNPSQRVAQLASIEAQFLANGGEGSLFLYPTKGYFDSSDKAALRGMGVRLRPYPRYKMWLKAKFLPSAPMIMMGIWHHSTRL